MKILDKLSNIRLMISIFFCLSNYASFTPEQPYGYLPAVDQTSAPASVVTEAATAPQTWRASELMEDGELTTTIDDNRGDWYFKRMLLKAARTVYESVRDTVAKIDAYKKDFFAVRSAIDSDLDTFYITYGFESGEIDEQLANLTQSMDEMRKKDIQLNEQERGLLAELNEKQKEVEQVKLDLISIHELDVNLDKALATLLDQISVSHMYEQKSWENYDKISEVLSDEIAERLYLEIQGYKSNAEAIDAYIKGPFAEYFDQSIKTIKEQMEKVIKQVGELKQRGVLLEKKVVGDQTTLDAQQKQQEEENKQKLEKERVAKQRRWWTPIVELPGTIIRAVGNMFSGIWNFFTSLFVSTPVKLKVPEKAPVIEPVLEQTPEPVVEPEPTVTVPEPQAEPQTEITVPTEPVPALEPVPEPQAPVSVPTEPVTESIGEPAT